MLGAILNSESISRKHSHAKNGHKRTFAYYMRADVRKENAVLLHISWAVCMSNSVFTVLHTHIYLNDWENTISNDFGVKINCAKYVGEIANMKSVKSEDSLQNPV